MGDKTSIEWARSDDGSAGATWNVFRGTVGRWACTRVSPGCDFCYAATLNRRFGGPDFAQPGRALNDTLRLDEAALVQPLRWQRPRRIFVHSMTDTFHESVSVEWLDKLFAVMALAGRHTFQVLTKRPGRMRDYCADPETPRRIGRYMSLGTLFQLPSSYAADGAQMSQWGRGGVPWPLRNVWMGTSIELDRFAWRANLLRETPAAIRFISAEPLLGPLDSLDLTGIDWLVVGGESAGPAERRLVKPCRHLGVQPADFPEYFGPDGACTVCNATGWEPKPAELAWLWKLRDLAEAGGTAFFLKQLGGPRPKSGGRLLDGREWSEFPTARVAAGARR